MSASELFDLISPAVTVISAVVSTWVLTSARRRFKLYQALLIAGASFFLPLIVVPLYLVTLLLWKRPRVQLVKWRLVIPLAFLVVLLGTLTLNKFLDDRTVDAHLSRAKLAKVKNDPNTAASEYRKAIEIENDPHTHKLLAHVLEGAGNLNEAITELRIAEKGGEPDDAIYYHLGDFLQRAQRKDESIVELKKFVASPTCLQIDARCEDARQRIEKVAR